eukprot:scaffold449_cov241-Pinguiococcus_pyrenoidosus.AAC.21
MPVACWRGSEHRSALRAALRRLLRQEPGRDARRPCLGGLPGLVAHWHVSGGSPSLSLATPSKTLL